MKDKTPITISSETFVRGILMLLGVYVIFLLRDVLVLVLVSVVLATFVESGVRFFKRFNIRRELSVPLIFLCVVLIIFGIVYSFIPIIFRELSGVITVISQYLPVSQKLDTTSLEGASKIVTSISEKSSLAEVLANVKEIASTVSSGMTSFIGSTFGGVVNLILVLVMSFYLSIQEKGITTLLRLLTPSKKENYVIGLWLRAQYKMGLWFQGQLFLGVVMGLITFITLMLFGVQYSFLIGVVTGIAELIPFGIIFAAIPAIIFAAIDGGLILAFKILIFYIVIQQIENYVLGPLIAKRVVGIPPLIVLLSLLIGITLAGFWGAVVAMPVAVLILEYISDVEKEKSIVRITTNK